MYLKTDQITVAIDNIVMRSWKMNATEQFILDPTAVVGWHDGTDVRRDSTARLGSNGDFREPATLGARQIIFTGIAVAKTASGLQHMRDALVGLMADGRYEQLTVQTTTGIRYAEVGLEGTTSWIQITDTAASWKISFYAPDPFVYGEIQYIRMGAKTSTGGLEYRLSYPLKYNMGSSNTAQTIKNNGNFASWPKFRVTGDYYSGFSISDNLNNTVTYAGMVTMQSPVLIDMRTGTATQNDVDKSVLVSKREWFSVPAQATIQPIFTPIQAGSGWCDIIFRDTWI